MKLFKKKGWGIYLFLFVVFSVTDFLANIAIDHHELRYSIISGLVFGVFNTILWWFLVQGHEQIKAAAKEDEAERKRKEKK